VSWAGEANGLTGLTGQPSPNAAFATALIPDAELLFAQKLSKETQKKLRKKKLRLATVAPLTFACPDQGAGNAAILDAFFAQKTTRFRDQNIVSEFEDPAMRDFIERASTKGPYGQGIELHALYCGTRIAAVYGGAAHRGHWSGMFNSFDAAYDIARSSPGDLLLMNIMSQQCLAGTKQFDLGIGEARYKTIFCGDAVELYDSFLAVNNKGRLFLLIQALALRTKSGIKSHRGLFHLFRRLHVLIKHRATAL
jgi:CelD/BcsL family acetyltransferase involved in cellulose biosynthesis